MTERESGIGKLLDLARNDRTYLEALDKLRRSIVVMFTDIQGSTAYFDKHGDAAGLLMVHQCNEALRAIVDTHGGRVIKTIGDGMLATFEDCGQSVEAGIEMQHGLREISNTLPEAERVAIRIGIHYDTGIVRTQDVFGDVVNVASRIESVAQAWQIVISENLYERVLDLKFQIKKLGRFLLKGKKSERTLYEVLWKRARLDDSGKAEAGNVSLVVRSSRLQVTDKLGATKAEYRLGDGITIGRNEGDVTFPEDVAMAPISLRIYEDDGQVFVKDLSQGSENVFIRIAAGYTLQNQDIVLMGRQVFKFREVSGAMSAANELGIDLAEVSRTLDEPVAELQRLHPAEGAQARFPLSIAEVGFGRIKGTYTFPEDKLMSRAHARVLQRAEDFVVEDLGSRNGTFVKVRGIAPLAANGMILLGNQLLRVVQ
ncbi:MAG: adenylate/guanylate cyclase domain-containing protein [Candidatus Korobacteraceae bacterium]